MKKKILSLVMVVVFMAIPTLPASAATTLEGKAPNSIKAAVIGDQNGSWQVIALLPKETVSNSITFKSSNKKIAKVDENGKIQIGALRGKCKITATVDGKSASFNIEVNNYGYDEYFLTSNSEYFPLLGVADDYSYYADKNVKGIYKHKTGEKTATLISTDTVSSYPSLFGTGFDVKFIAVEDRIYYEKLYDGIYTMRNDGSEKKKLVNNYVGRKDGWHRYMYVDGDFLYYETGDGLYRVKNNGIEKIKITQNEVGYIHFIDSNWMYYESNAGFFRVRTDGTGKTEQLVTDNGEEYDYTVKGTWIYFSNGQEINRIRINGTEKNLIVKLPDEDPEIFVGKELSGISLMAIDDNRIYYVGIKQFILEVYESGFNMGTPYLHGFYMVRTNGTGKTKIIDGYFHDFFMKEPGAPIFYAKADDGYYTVKNDGSGRKKLFDLKKGETYKAHNDGEWVYYTIIKPNEAKYGVPMEYGLYRVKTDGTKRETLINGFGLNWDSLVIKDGWIYYSFYIEDGYQSDVGVSLEGYQDVFVSSFNKMKVDGTQKTKLTGQTVATGSENRVITYTFITKNGYVYYYTFESSLMSYDNDIESMFVSTYYYFYKKRTDGKDDQFLTLDEWVNEING